MSRNPKIGWGYWWNDRCWHYVGNDGITLCSARKKPDGYKPLFADPSECQNRFEDLNQVCETCRRIKSDMDLGLDKIEKQLCLL